MAARQVKAVNPNVFCFFYLNSLIAFTAFQRITNVTEASPHNYYAVDTKGNFVVTIPSYKTFDHTISATRNLFVNDCLYGINSGVFDGWYGQSPSQLPCTNPSTWCSFIDRANYAEGVLANFNGSIPKHNWDLPTTKRLINGSKLVRCLMVLKSGVGCKLDHCIIIITCTCRCCPP